MSRPLRPETSPEKRTLADCSHAMCATVCLPTQATDRDICTFTREKNRECPRKIEVSSTSSQLLFLHHRYGCTHCGRTFNNASNRKKHETTCGTRASVTSRASLPGSLDQEALHRRSGLTPISSGSNRHFIETPSLVTHPTLTPMLGTETQTPVDHSLMASSVVTYDPVQNGISATRTAVFSERSAGILCRSIGTQKNDEDVE